MPRRLIPSLVSEGRLSYENWEDGDGTAVVLLAVSEDEGQFAYLFFLQLRK